MQRIVHILNGDSTAYGLEKAEIKGDLIIWREMLSEGPLHPEIGTDVFWKRRYGFFENKLGVSKLDYYDKTITELIKIEDLSDYDEVILWFEFDLFCQINLLALCTYLLKHFKKSIDYYLICTGEETGKARMQSLSDYSPEEYSGLLETKIKLTRKDLLYAERCWEVIVKNRLQELSQFDFSSNAKFKYLQSAVNQHLQRFPNKNGLSQIDNKILEIINSGVSNKRDIIKGLLHWQREETVYGFGDLQYDEYLKQLNAYYDISNDKYVLNKKGKMILTKA